MEFTLLTSTPSSAIHLMYYVQTKKLKIKNVVVVRKEGMQYDVLEQYSEINNFAIDYVDDPNGTQCETVLSKLKPKVLILMISTILEDKVLKIPEMVINTHSGILPKYRGVDSHRWAILDGGSVGVSVHYVDSGVDTGPVLKTNELPIRSGDTISSIAERNYYTNKWQTLTETLIELDHGNTDPQVQCSDDGKQYFWMHVKLRDIVDDILEKKAHPDLK